MGRRLDGRQARDALPGSFLIGEGARADHLNVGVASGDVWKDTGAKVVHLAPNTNSNILAKSISKDGGIMGYRGLVRMGHNSQARRPACSATA